MAHDSTADCRNSVAEHLNAAPRRGRWLWGAACLGLGAALVACSAEDESSQGGDAGSTTSSSASSSGQAGAGGEGGGGASAGGSGGANVGGAGGAADDGVFRVAACQLVGGIATTKQQKLAAMNQALQQLADEAVNNAADMLVFPETAFVSYECAPRPALAEAVPSSDTNDVYHHMAQYAEQHGVWLYYGDYVQSNDPSRPHNSGIMIRPDGTLGFVYHKHYGSSSEAGCGSYGEGAYVFDVGHPLGRIGCLICKDFHAGGTGDIDNLAFEYMLGIAGDANRTGNHYEAHMNQIITSAPAKSQGGVWVNLGNVDGESFFMSPDGQIQEDAPTGAGDLIVYHDYDI